jgi:hypothetical protein
MIEVTHIESWAVSITPDEGAGWPVIPGGAGRNDLQPDLILLQVIPGQALYVTGSGLRKRRDGSDGALRVNAPWVSLDDLPDWAGRLVADALRQHSLSQLAPHAVAPLPGSVRTRDGKAAQRVKPGDYPLTALCSQCHKAIRSGSFEIGWIHDPIADKEGS